MAWRLHEGGRNVDIDDLVAYGQIGLLEAIQSLTKSVVKFATFAWYRVRAIFDGLTKMSWFNRITFEQGEYETQNVGNSLAKSISLSRRKEQERRIGQVYVDKISPL